MAKTTTASSTTKWALVHAAGPQAHSPHSQYSTGHPLAQAWKQFFRVYMLDIAYLHR